MVCSTECSRCIGKSWPNKIISILDGDNKIELLKSHKMNLDEATWQARQTQWFINKQKDESRRVAKLPNKATYVEEKMADIYLEYQKTCEEEGVVDFAEILLRSYEMLNKNPQLLLHYQKFQHILVDEFQDKTKFNIFC